MQNALRGAVNKKKTEMPMWLMINMTDGRIKAKLIDGCIMEN